MVETKTCPYCAEEIKSEAIRCRYCLSWLSYPPIWPGGTRPGDWFRRAESPKGGPAPFSRPIEGRIILGVCAGIARFFGLDATLVRVLYVVLTFLTLGAPGVILYLVLALVIPSDDGAGLV